MNLHTVRTHRVLKTEVSLESENFCKISQYRRFVCVCECVCGCVWVCVNIHMGNLETPRNLIWMFGVVGRNLKHVKSCRLHI